MDTSYDDELRETLRYLDYYRMPFGAYGPKAYPPKGIPLYELPYEYLRHFERKGYPGGRLGRLMKFVHDIKRDGAESIFGPLRDKNGAFPLRAAKGGKSFVFD
jgi:hypothetical protein